MIQSGYRILQTDVCSTVYPRRNLRSWPEHTTVAVGIGIESGKVAVTEEMKVKLLEALEKFNPEAPLTMLFDYVRIRFPTLDIGHIIKDILKLNIQYMIHEEKRNTEFWTEPL